MAIKEVGHGGVGGKFGRIGGEQMQPLQDLNGQACAEAWFTIVTEVGGVMLLQVPGVFYGSGEAANLTSRLIRMIFGVFFRHGNPPQSLLRSALPLS